MSGASRNKKQASRDKKQERVQEDVIDNAVCCKKEKKFNEATGLNYSTFDDIYENNFSQATGI